MKNNVFGILLLCVMFSSCLSDKKRTADVSEGWVSPDAYRVSVTGSPGGNQSGESAEVRNAALREAVNIAQGRVLEKFIDMQRYDYQGSNVSTPSDIRYSFDPVVKRGVIISTLYDSENYCTIVYEVRQKNLKQNVTRFVPSKKAERRVFPSTSGMPGTENCHCTAGVWEGANICRITAVGFSRKDITDIKEKRRLAAEAAKVSAYDLAVFEFTRFRMENRKNGGAETMIKAAIHKKLSEVIRAGSIVKMNFDKDDNCEIEYQIVSDRLAIVLLSDNFLK